MKQKAIPLTLPAQAQRLDAALLQALQQVPELSHLSRAQLQGWIKQGFVTTVDGRTVTQPSLKLKAPLDVIVHAPQKEAFAPPKAEARDPALQIVYEDDYLLVINKPVGLTVHPGAGRKSGTLVNMLLGHTDGHLSDIGTHERPGIVHRLDKDTSGLMMVAKTNAVHVALAEALQRRDIKRVYHTIIWGLINPTSGTIDAPIGRDPKNRQRMMVLGSGRPSTTHYRLLRALNMAFSLVECRLETGRTHQIRVHMAHLGFPVVGDPTYAGRYPRRVKNFAPAIAEALNNTKTQALHATELHFVHPVTGAEMAFTADYPPSFADLLAALSAS